MAPDELGARFERDGFIVLPGFKSAAEVAALRERAHALVDAFDPGARRSIFSTQDQSRTSDAEFLASAEGVHCFFEEEAFDAAGQLCVPKAKAINKIGHALHDLDPVFERFSHGPALDALARRLGLVDALVWQSMLIFKQPAIGGEVKWHQDATFLHTAPCTVTAFWFALEDATLDNGCLWVQPGGHRGPLRERFVREGDNTRMEVLDRTPWPTQAQALPVEVAAGTLVAFHGLLPHYSAPNRSPLSRQAYTLHATDAGSAYAADNWLQRPTLPLRGFQ
ncbi:MAG: phytanoyl-CoA dioxygenase family protein [Burkholderiales bacterium]|nr:phytanoyl-CoA dioxygenase family protein [Burkholderiales bacterium]